MTNEESNKLWILFTVITAIVRFVF